MEGKMIEEVFADLKESMDKAIANLDKEYKRVRTGRASTALLEGIMVEAYGAPTPLNQVASLSAPEPRLLLIQPWDKSIMGDVEKAILKSELGLTPMNDGKVVRISIPPLSEERRRELVKVTKKMAEEAKVAIRGVRRSANEMLKELKAEKEISEDEMYKATEEVQKVTDSFVAKADQVAAEKEKEIMSF
jgi:ribosome recycling factor